MPVINHFLYHGHLVHPDIWILWMAGILTPVNTLGLVWLLMRRRG
jgi:hypothetical protein